MKTGESEYQKPDRDIGHKLREPTAEMVVGLPFMGVVRPVAFERFIVVIGEFAVLPIRPSRRWRLDR